MEILVPLGLLALLGIVVLIIIYIIKPRYQKKNISSTFIWKLSLRYRKKKIPLQWLQKSLLLFIQICVIGLITSVLIEPAVRVMGKDAEKAIILDVSYSMQAEVNGETRLDRAIKQIEKDLNNVNEENKLTIILGKNEPTYLVRRESSVSLIKYALSNIQSTYEECNFESSLYLANTVIDENPSTIVYYYTDCQYASTGYVNVIDFSNNEWNVSLTEVKKYFENGEYVFETNVCSYNREFIGKIALSIDGKVKLVQDISLLKNEEVKVLFNKQNIINYKDYKLELLDTNNNAIQDSLLADNIYFEQDYENITHNVELVGKSNTFISSALKSCANVDIYLPKEEKEIAFKDKELYIFDSYVPSKLPEDGVIWFINPTKKIPNLDLIFEKEISGKFTFSSCNNLSNEANKIMNLITPNTIEATKYSVLNNYQDYEVLIECNNNPILLLGHYKNAKIMVLAVDLHYTNLPITMNFIVLMNNLFDYSVKTTLYKGIYNIGENIQINSKVLTKELYFDDKLKMNSFDYKDSINEVVNKPGIFEIKQIMTNGTTIVDKVFIKTSENESNFRYTVDTLAVDRYINPELNIEGRPGFDYYDYTSIAKYFAIALLVLVIVEWGVQYREQY